MRKHIAVIAACCLLSLSGVAYGANSAASAMQKRYAATTTMSAEFVQILTHKESGGTEERRGVFYFSKPAKVCWETLSPMRETLFITPEAIWNVFFDEDMAYKYPAKLPTESENIIRVVTGQSALDKNYVVENKGEKDGLTTLALYPNNPTQSLTEAELSVETKTGVIKRAVIIDFYYNRNEIAFTNQKFDGELSDAVFYFIPQKGMKVEDKTRSESLETPLLR